LRTEEIHGVECRSCKRLRNQLALEQLQKFELADALSKATKIVSAAEMLELGSSPILPSAEKSIKFFVVFGELHEQMEILINKIGKTERLQIVVEINTQTSEALSISVTKANEHDGMHVMRLSEANG
jgi:hypothetical protein